MSELSEAWRRQRAAIVHVDLDRALAPVAVPGGYPTVMLVVHLGGAVVGHLLLPATGPELSVARQRAAIVERLGRQVGETHLRRALTTVVSGSDQPAPLAPIVSVVVCTRDRPDRLAACLASLAALRTPPLEVLVVDNAPSDDAARRLCERHPVRYVLEPIPGQTRARNRGIVESRGDVVAFTDDDCVVDARWLDELGRPFADPLVMAVTGYTGPVELDHHAQYLFEVHGGFDRHARPRVFDPLLLPPIRGAASAGAGANMLLRRSIFDRIGLFAEDLGPGTPARAGDDKELLYRLLTAGFRIAYEPTRIVWHRHRADWPALRRALEDYGTAEVAYTGRALVRHGDFGVARIWRWWARHMALEVKRAALRTPRRLPLGMLAAEATGIVKGPVAALRSTRSRASIPPIELPGPASTAPSAAIAVRREPPPGLSVTIASRERSALLRRILLAFAEQDHPADRVEVVVALDGSTDDSAAMARALELPYALRVLEHERQGAATTRNRGAAEARHPIVVFIDDDIVPVPGFLSEHARAHAEDGGDGLAMGFSPAVVTEDGLWAHTLRAWWADHFRRKTAPGHRWRFTEVLAGNASIPQRLFLGTGGYDATLEGRREDWEQGVRLLRLGVPMRHVHGAEGAHHLDASFATAVRNARLEGRGDVRLARLHPEVAASLPLIRLAGSLARHPRRAPWTMAQLDRLEAALPAALRLLDGLEGAGRRRRWRQLMSRVLLCSYVLGVLDEVGDVDGLRTLLDEARAADGEAGETIALAIEDPQPPPDRLGLGPIELELRLRGRRLRSIPAVLPGGQWDWAAITERVIDGAGGPALLELGVEVLDGATDDRAGRPVVARTR